MTNRQKKTDGEADSGEKKNTGGETNNTAKSLPGMSRLKVKRDRKGNTIESDEVDFSGSTKMKPPTMKALESNSNEDIEESTDNIINDTGNDMTNLTVWAANVTDKVNQSMQLKSNKAEKDQVAELTEEVNQSTKLNAIKLTKMIMKPLTQEEESQLNRVINDTERNPIKSL